jgi:hypothetical protein
MNRAQRVVLILYCLAVAYCCVWVPWHYSMESMKDLAEGYGLIWNGPPQGFGTPNLAAIASRVFAATALGVAAFLLTGKWRSS